MKTLIIVRHAKSAWNEPLLTDFDRTLNDRGLKDAPVMGRRLSERKFPLDLIVSSTARRAELTALLLAKEIAYDTEKIKWIAELYHASAQKITGHILEFEDQYKAVMIVCHNPGITHFVNMQCGFVTDNVPTCGITVFDIKTDRWEDFLTADKKLVFHDFPKNQ